MFTVSELLEIAARSRDVILFHRICDELLAKKEEKSTDIRAIITAKEVAKNPKIYYGAKVTNYSVNEVSDFKIIHSDGENIYLIASDCILINKIPATKSGNKLENTDTDYPKAAPLTNAVSDLAYAKGSEAIGYSNPARKWLSSYLDNYSSTNTNMKAVAYMMDTSVWDIFKSDMAEYVIGGPTIEMLFDSYNNKYGTTYQAKATSDVGYQISKDGGLNWKIWYIDMFDTFDPLYGIICEKDVLAYYIVSPSNHYIDEVLTAFNNGIISGNSYSNTYYGFRPVVCLKSDISLTREIDGSVTLNYNGES